MQLLLYKYEVELRSAFAERQGQGKTRQRAENAPTGTTNVHFLRVKRKLASESGHTRT